MKHYLYFTADKTISFSSSQLDGFSERHFVQLEIKPLDSSKDSDAIIAVTNGYIKKGHLKLAKQTLAKNLKAWFYWPQEEAIELIDKEKLQSYQRHYYFAKIFCPFANLVFDKIPKGLRKKFPLFIKIIQLIRNRELNDDPIFREKLLNIHLYPTPTRMPKKLEEARGIYLRTDFWSKTQDLSFIEKLAKTTKEFLLFLPHKQQKTNFAQIIFDSPTTTNETQIVNNTPNYYKQLKNALQIYKPDFIYERICLGNYAGALVSKELKIPYIVEYAPEIDKQIFAKEYLKAQQAALKQASIIVAFEKESLLEQNILESKILLVQQQDNIVTKLEEFLAKSKEKSSFDKIETGDEYKNQVQNQWNNNPCGSHYAQNKEKHTLDWFLEVERYRYKVYGPWMPKLMEFAQHPQKKVLEIGAGLGTDLSQFAKNKSIVTDIDLSMGHMSLAQKNFQLRELQGKFIHHDAENLPFEDNSFDIVYSNGVIHHTPNTQNLVKEIFRILKPKGKAIIMVYAENSLHYWFRLVFSMGIRAKLLEKWSIGGIMSRHVEVTEENEALPLVKVYTPKRLKQMFAQFANIKIYQRQLTKADLSSILLLPLRLFPLCLLERLMGWNLIIKAYKADT